MADSSNTDFAQHSPLLVGPTEVGGENEEHGASKSHGSGVVCSQLIFYFPTTVRYRGSNRVKVALDFYRASETIM